MKDEVIRFRSGVELKKRLIGEVGIGNISSYIRSLVETDLDSRGGWVGPQFKNDKLNKDIKDGKY